MVKLSPTLRERWRYLAIAGASYEEIKKAIKVMFGRFFLDIISPKLIEHGELTIMRIPRWAEDYVRASIVLFNFNRPVFVVLSSGTLKKLRQKIGDRRGI